jgi:putative membrane protein insertion efficiency factor
MSASVSPVARGLTWLVRGYQLVLSPLLGPRCRFYPSCSSYAVQALTTHGALKGTWLAGRRLLRCHPWNPGGVDHVPPAGHSTAHDSTTSHDSTGPRALRMR